MTSNFSMTFPDFGNPDSEHYLRKFSEHSVATALANNVLPVPGGPYNKTPETTKKIQ